MDRAAELALIERCLAQYAQGRTALGEAPVTSPVERYTCGERHGREMARIHRRLPVPWLHASEVLAPGDFRRVDTPLGEVLFIRDDAGRARAFHNVCRHRGASLVVADAGSARRLVCPYHAWSYGSDGALLSVPAQVDCFPGLDKSEMGLVGSPCAEACGLLWLCPEAPADGAGEYLHRYLGALAPDLDWLGMDRLQPFARHRRVWRANWKLVSEGGLETYHFKTAHRDSIGPFFPNNLSVQDRLGIHSRVVMPSEKIRQVIDQPSGDRRIRDFTHILFGVAPQTSFLAQARHVDWIRMTPLAVDATEIVITSLVPAGEGELSDDERRHWQANFDITVNTLDEDFLIGEAIQRGLASGANRELLFGRNESLLQAFNEWIDARIAD